MNTITERKITMNVPVSALAGDIGKGKLEVRTPLHLVEDNPRLKEDIRANGVKEPIEIRFREDMTRILWDGHHRLKIAIELNLDSIPMALKML